MNTMKLRHWTITALVCVAVGLAAVVADADLIADSENEFSGTQGDAGWSYGYHNVSINGPYEVVVGGTDDFIQFDNAIWDGGDWDMNTAAAQPWTVLDAEGGHPNGTNQPEEHWAVRRWTADQAGSVKANLEMWRRGGGNTNLHVIVNGDLRHTYNTGFYPQTRDHSIQVSVPLLNLQVGDKVDFVIDPNGPDGSDSTGFVATIDSDPTVLTLAHSVADFSGTQGQDNWRYGMYDQTADALDSDGVYQQTDFDEFPADWWTGGKWDVPDGNPPWTEVTGSGGHPNGTNNDDEHWPIRRYVVDAAGSIQANLEMWRANVNGNTNIRVYRNGVLQHIRNLPANSAEVNHAIALRDVEIGDVIDFAIDPNGSDGSDGTGLIVTIDNTVHLPIGTVLANSIAEFSGVQGQLNWHQGYYIRGPLDSPDPAYDATPGGTDDFIAFPDTMWTGNDYDIETGGAQPWTFLAAETAHPNGTNQPEEHWTVRRWVSNHDGPMDINWNLRKDNAVSAADQGVTGKVFVNGVEVDTATIAGNDAVGISQTVRIPANVGDFIDIILSPENVNGDHVDGSDGSFYSALMTVAAPTLWWDRSDSDWAEVVGGNSHWIGSVAGAIPDASIDAYVLEGTATVSDARAARDVKIGGAVQVAAGGTLDVAGSVDVDEGGTLGVAATGSLNAAAINSRGAVTLESGSTGTVPEINVAGGTLDLGVNLTTLNIADGAVTTSAAVTVDDVAISGGSLTLGGDATVQTLIASGGLVNTGGHQVIVNDFAKADVYNFDISDGNSFAIRTDNALAGAQFTLSGGALTITADRPPADVMTFSDLDPDPGNPAANQQEAMPSEYSTGLPAGVTATWSAASDTDGFVWKKTAGPEDHTPDTDDHMQIWSRTTGSVSFSEPLLALEMWVLDGNWGDTGNFTLTGMLDDVEQWSTVVPATGTWVSITDGAELPIDTLNVTGGLWNHWDDLAFVRPDDVPPIQLPIIDLVVTADSEIVTDAPRLDLGNLTVQADADTLGLQGGIYSFGSVNIAGSLTLTGEVEILNELSIGDGVAGELVLDAFGELVFDPAAAFNVEVNLGGSAAAVAADKIVNGAAIHLDGKLALKGVGRSDANFFSASTLTIVDNASGGFLDGVGPNSDEFAAVDPAPADDMTGHIGQGAFLREVDTVTPPVGGGALRVEVELFVALGGDADGDKKVWLSDWAALRAGFGNTATDKTWTDGNFDPWVDGKVWLSDWAALRENFGNSDYTAAGAAAVPEPSTIVMLLGGLIGLALIVRRRRAA